MTRLTAQQIIEAAEALTSEGVAVTVAAIRERLGSGSFSTIQKHLSNWRTDNQPGEVPAMPVSAETAFNRVWIDAYRAAQAQFTPMVESLNAQQKEALQASSELSDEVVRLEQDNETLRDRISTLEAARRRQSPQKIKIIQLPKQEEQPSRSTEIEVSYPPKQPDSSNTIDFRIVELKKQGLSLHSIAKRINGEGLTGAKGGQWYAAGIRKVLMRYGRA